MRKFPRLRIADALLIMVVGERSASVEYCSHPSDTWAIRIAALNFRGLIVTERGPEIGILGAT